MSLPRKIMEQWRLCPAKSWSNADLAPRRSQSLCSLPRKIKETWFLALKNYGAMQTFSNYFCKSLSFPRSLQPFGPLFRGEIFCVTVPLRWGGRWGHKGFHVIFWSNQGIHYKSEPALRRDQLALWVRVCPICLWYLQVNLERWSYLKVKLPFCGFRVRVSIW